jgi:hypothetical protein
MMEHSELLTRAAAWMQVRDWKQKLVKNRGYEKRYCKGPVPDTEESALNG